MTEDDWVESNGGPLVALDERLKPLWGGVFSLSVPQGKAEHDYDRACAIDGYLGKVPIANCEALIVGEEPSSHCLWRSPGGRLHIVKVHCCEEDFDVALKMQGFESRLPQCEKPQELDFTFHGTKLVIFDSAKSGEDDYSPPIDYNHKVMTASLDPGAYRISVYSFDPDETCELTVYRFDPQ